ncbi:type II toxin-antitoxin system Phd/YefM family antitoxin [Pseudogemmobacter sp. W21_MBD1_M6]|uniref:type II toxin-antitoxin system Phd/YefM family antitoxin n=1 Tax=Pseudogemmobacter sp. W21_MBD1_M6 TaxID=3240271 RepID=UPI003F972C38
MWTLQDAKNKFSTVVDAALAGTPQEVTRRGKPAVVVLSATEYHQLLKQAQSRRGSFTDHLLSYPGGDDSVERAHAAPRPVDF